MRKGRDCIAEGSVYMDLFWCVVQMIITPYDMGNFHIYVIDNDAEIVCWSSVRTNNDKVIKLGIIKNDLASYQVIDNRLSFLRHLESYCSILSLNPFDIPAASIVFRRFSMC